MMALDMFNLQTALAVLAALCLTVSGYKNGKVEKACESMLPEHHNHPNTTTSPYTLTASVSQFSPGDQIKGTANHYNSVNDYRCFQYICIELKSKQCFLD